MAHGAACAATRGVATQRVPLRATRRTQLGGGRPHGARSQGARGDAVRTAAWGAATRRTQL